MMWAILWLVANAIIVWLMWRKHRREELPEFLSLAIAPCHRCRAELWLGGEHAAGCENSAVLHLCRDEDDEAAWWVYDKTRTYLVYGPYADQQQAIDAVAVLGDSDGNEHRRVCS